MASVSGWGIDAVTLEAAYKHWIAEYQPNDHEIASVDARLEHLKANGPVGGRVPGTNIVIDYVEDTKHRYLWISKIAPPA